MITVHALSTSPTGLGKLERKEHFLKLPTIVTLNMKMFSRFNKLAKVNLTLKSSLSLTLSSYLNMSLIFMNFNILKVERLHERR